MKMIKKLRMVFAVAAFIALASLTSLAVYSAQTQISLDSPASLPSDI